MPSLQPILLGGLYLARVLPVAAIGVVYGVNVRMDGFFLPYTLLVAILAITRSSLDVLTAERFRWHWLVLSTIPCVGAAAWVLLSSPAPIQSIPMVIMAEAARIAIAALPYRKLRLSVRVIPMTMSFVFLPAVIGQVVASWIGQGASTALGYAYGVVGALTTVTVSGGLTLSVRGTQVHWTLGLLGVAVATGICLIVVFMETSWTTVARLVLILLPVVLVRMGTAVVWGNAYQGKQSWLPLAHAAGVAGSVFVLTPFLALALGVDGIASAVLLAELVVFLIVLIGRRQGCVTVS